MTMLPLPAGESWNDFNVDEPASLYHIIEFPAETLEGPIERETVEFIRGFVSAEYSDCWWRVTVRQDAWADLDEPNRAMAWFLHFGEL